MQSPHVALRPSISRVLLSMRERWPLIVPGVLLLMLHLLPVPQNGKLAGMPVLCPLKALTGWPCPGCGLTRALVLCAHGDWQGAFNYHPLGAVFYFTLWIALALGVFSLLRKHTAASLLELLPQRGILFACVAALVGVWLIRLSGFFPYPPHF